MLFFSLVLNSILFNIYNYNSTADSFDVVVDEQVVSAGYALRRHYGELTLNYGQGYDGDDDDDDDISEVATG